MAISPGTRVRRYEVTAPLGAGGMGEVYLARDVELDRTVALKILPQAHDDSDDRIRRFVQEAKAACALNHPSVAHIYDVGEENGVRFMAMEYVEGMTLRERMRHPISRDEALDIAIQIASALASAHAAGVVHRDIKPENVMLRPDGYVKVLDFGLAKLIGVRSGETTLPVRTETGVVMGTVNYMSPEQLRGSDVDARTDVFSLGVLLYELLANRRPFEGDSSSDVIVSILSRDPLPMSSHVPADVQAALMKALAKEREQRFAGAREFGETLKRLRGSSGASVDDLPTEILTTKTATPPRRAMLAVIAAIAIALALGAWAFVRWRNVRAARESLAQVETLTAQRRYFEAYDLAKSIERYVGKEPRFTTALDKMTGEITVKSDPPGARVWLERFVHGERGPRELIGSTPLEHRRIAKGAYLATIEQDGFAPHTMPVSLAPMLVYGEQVDLPLPPLTVKLTRAADVPHDMVPVPGGLYRLTGWGRATDTPATLAPFFIDRFEVSNADFEKFIVDGGYRRRELWPDSFVKDGKVLAFDEAIAAMHDTTGLPGPRSWSGQKYAQGRERYPVTDVTWYEASAYAKWAGKQLPTVYEWDKAARNGKATFAGHAFPWGVVTDPSGLEGRANFGGNGPLPVDSLPFGMSAWGVYHTAGNVAEWMRNEFGDGRTTAGGGFDDPSYLFGRAGSFPPFYSSPKLGFRCVKEISHGDQGSGPLPPQIEVPVLHPASDAEFAKIAARYEYAPEPLAAHVVEKSDAEAWTRETIAFRGANGKTATLYLYLPKQVRPPLQVIHYVPASDVELGVSTLTHALELAMAPHIRAGRAVFGVLLEGYSGRPRPNGAERPNQGSDEYVDDMVGRVIDSRRALDYLATRPELDMKKLGFYGPSAGSSLGLVLTAIDHRYAAVFLLGAGVSAGDNTVHPAARRPNFAPHITAQKAMLHGRYDESQPLRTNAEPLFRILREPKKLIVYEGGHIAPPEVAVPAANAFFNEVLGKP
ncbi:MAG TPA: bifunctional serine/threonine-protein kinase/formylglycine-generating enzyme family protein [Thermoanaerobaculia bacterium]|nr:bifunctional serine/threonine-protein kinase/formylglycine-generating enzyme family protein [Thermoanaerobaculia bacterium]